MKMERLTKRSSDTTHENGVCCTHFGGPDCCEVEGNCAMGCPWEEAAWERLAAYEDTGLSPEEIVKMGMAYEDSKRYSKRLEGRIKAYGEGRAVVLPCKAGDTVYEVTSRKTISEYCVKAIRVELFAIFIEWRIEKGFVDKSIFGVVANEIGKTVFLTREEAEKALEGMK